MNSLKQTIVNAVLRVTMDSKYNNRSYETPEEARDDFVKALIAELFPESPEMPGSSGTVETVEVPVLPESPKKEDPPKKKGGRKPKAEKPAEDKPVEAEKPAEAEAEAEKPAEPTEEKKKRKYTPPTGQRVKPGPKPKPKPEGPVNLEKLNPTQSKKLKAANVEDKKAFLAYINALAPELYNDATKTFEDHVKNYIASTTPAAPDTPKTLVAEVETLEVEFEGETYYVDPATKKVYKETGAVSEYVGDVGLAKFADMKVPDDV